MGKAFEKQIKTIQCQGKKQVDALKFLEPKEQTNPIEDKSNNQSRAAIIFNDLINKRKSIMNELYGSVDKNNLKFDYVGPTEDVSFYKHMDFKELFSEIKNNRLKFDDAVKRQKELLKKINEVKIGKRPLEQKEVIDNLAKFYKSRKEVLHFFRVYTKMLFDANYNAKKDKTKGTGLRILTPKQMLQRLPIALAQVKAGNKSDSLLNEIKQIVYSLYQSKEITKKVYNNRIKSIQ